MKQINHYFKSESPILQLVSPVPKSRGELGTELHGITRNYTEFSYFIFDAYFWEYLFRSGDK